MLIHTESHYNMCMKEITQPPICLPNLDLSSYCDFNTVLDNISCISHLTFAPGHLEHSQAHSLSHSLLSSPPRLLRSLEKEGLLTILMPKPINMGRTAVFQHVFGWKPLGSPFLASPLPSSALFLAPNAPNPLRQCTLTHPRSTYNHAYGNRIR
jgi:hypothetical protein